jgi:hypothetical protein
MKSNLEYEYRPHTTKAILRTFAAGGALGLIAVCGGFVGLGPPTTDSPGPRRVSLGTVALEEAAGRGASSACGTFGALLAMVLCGGGAVLLGYAGVRMCLKRKQRIALLPKGVILPLAEKPIEYGRIRSLTLMNTGPAGARNLHVDYDKVKLCIIYEAGLPSPGAFDEIHAVLKRRTEAAAGSGGAPARGERRVTPR